MKYPRLIVLLAALSVPAVAQARPSTPVSSPAPTIKSLSPKQGLAGKPRSVTISGANFTGATEVHFGRQSASFTIVKSTRLKATTPVAETLGPVDVTVTTPAGTSEVTPADRYEFLADEPWAEEVSPEIGSAEGGDRLRLIGDGLLGTTEVHFEHAGLAPSFEVVNDHEMWVVNPPHKTERVAISVTTPVGTSPTLCARPRCRPIAHFVYRPEVTSITPGNGPEAGGTPITILGSGFNPKAEVRVIVGNRSATSIVCESEFECTAVTPSGGNKTGTVPVEVRVPSQFGRAYEANPPSEAAQFTYE